MAETVDEIIEKSKYASQLEALLMMLKGENVFLCGPPGSGKSFVIKKFVKIKQMINPKIRIETTSTTGISAINIGGKTIHSFTGMGVSKLNFEDKLADKSFDSRKLTNIKKADIIIIDEISMLSEWGLQYFYDVLNHLDRIGTVQIIVSGDFSQLPPVATRFDPPEMARICYNSQPWKDLDFKPAFLDRVYRTSDEDLKTILDNIAIGKANPEDLEEIKTVDNIDKTRRPILVSTNREVDSINKKKQRLNKEKKKYKFKLELPELPEYTKKTVDASKRFVKAMSMPNEIVLKKNDTIMITANDIPSMPFAEPIIEDDKNDGEFPVLKNGMIGIVWDISSNELIFAYQDPKTMNVYKYKILDKVKFEQKIIVKDKVTKRKKEITIAWFKQIPVKLAYAISIHKSQGQTYSHLVCDLSNCWAENLGYVALSRAESLRGISIVNNPYGPNVSDNALKCSQESINVKKDILKKSYFGSNAERLVCIKDELKKYNKKIRKELIDEEY